jgi:hypothetical protein
MAQRPRVLSAGEYPIHLYEIDVASGKFVPLVAEAEGEGSQAWSESHDESALSSPSDEQLSDLRLGGDEIEDSPAVRAVERKLLTAYKYKRSNTSSRRNRNLGRELISNTQSSSNGDQSDDEPESECNSISSSRSSGRNDVGSDADLKVAQAGKQFDDRDSHVEDIAEGSDIDLDTVVRRPPCSSLYQCPISNTATNRNTHLAKPARLLLHRFETEVCPTYQEHTLKLESQVKF